MPCGSVAEASTGTRVLLESTGVSVAYVLSIIALVWFSILRVIKLPYFRWDSIRLARRSPMICRAVRDANDMINAVIELSLKDTRDTRISSKIEEEAEKMRVLFFNIKLCSVDED